MKEHNIFELVRKFENGKRVYVEGKNDAQYNIIYKDDIYYVECRGGHYTEEFINFEEDE